MKNFIKRTTCIVFCLLTSLSLFFACAPTARQAGKSAPAPKLEWYEDKAIGFSIEYDAEKLPKDPGPIGPFVLRRESAEGMLGLAMTAGPYPSGIALKDTTDLISSSLPRMMPGSIIYEVYNQQLIKLKDGTEANYFEMKWNMGGMELISAIVATKKNDRLIVCGAADNEDGSMENLTALVTSLRLDVEVDEAALKARGFGKDGKFVRTDSPAFTLEYPKEFRNRVLYGNKIFRARIPQRSLSMSIAISSLNDGEDINKQLKALAEEYANSLKYIGSNIKIISQNPIKNYGEFDAYQIQIVWRYQGQLPLTTVVHIIAKENKSILLAGNTVYWIDELLDIFKTIDLNP